MSVDAVFAPVPGTATPPGAVSRVRAMQQEATWVRRGLIALALCVVSVLILIPLVNIFAYALSEGIAAYGRHLFMDPDTRHSILLTASVVPIAVGANVVFGMAAAWALARFRFPGRSILLALIDLPFAISPVVAGLMFVLIFGLQGYLGPLLRDDGYSIMPWIVAGLVVAVLAVAYILARPISPQARRGIWAHPRWVLGMGGTVTFVTLVGLQRALGIWPENETLRVLFAFPGIVIATAFVTLPFVARELIPVMEAAGADEELAAISLGATGWQMFRHVTLPNVRSGLAYGVILCSARAMGEFGAVYVVSGRISGLTDTMPLRIEKLFQEYDLPGAFSVASVLTLLALVTLVVKTSLERRAGARLAHRRAHR
ncbi:MAG: sulfate ABC transporter permease [Gemmatimonadales bacterium]